MADNVTPLQRELYEIAAALEAEGHPHLATVIDQCNEEVHTRIATVKPKATKPKARPARKASPSKVDVSSDLRKVKWARAELRDIARELKKSGSARDLRQAKDLLKLAEDLAEEALLIEGPMVTVEDDAIDMGGDVHDHGPGCCLHNHEQLEDEAMADFDGSDDSLGFMSEGEPHDHDGDIVVETDAVDTDEDVLDTVEACARELRICARLLKREGNTRLAAQISKWAESVQADADGTEPCELPEPNGESSVIDSTDYDFGSVDLEEVSEDVESESDDLVDFAAENAKSEEDADFADEQSENLFDEEGLDEGDEGEELLDDSEPMDHDEAEVESEEFVDEDQFDDNEPESTEETEEEVEPAIAEAAATLERTARLLQKTNPKQAATLRRRAAALRKS